MCINYPRFAPRYCPPLRVEQSRFLLSDALLFPYLYSDGPAEIRAKLRSGTGAYIDGVCPRWGRVDQTEQVFQRFDGAGGRTAVFLIRS